MNFISTNISRNYQYYLYDGYVSNMMNQTGDNIICDSLLCPDLVDTLNGAATAVVDMFQDRDYSFLYGCWHGIDRYVILDQAFNHQYTGYWQNFAFHSQSITINTNIVEEGSCYYDSVETGEHAGEFQYFYAAPARNYLQLEDVIPDKYGNTYLLWMSSCMTMDKNYESSSMPCARDSNNAIIQNCDITGWLFDVYVDSLPEPIINEENCINEVLFNEIGGPVAIYATTALDYPSLTRFIVNEYLDLIFIDNESKLGYLTDTAWDLFENGFDLYLYRLLYIGFTLFGDPSLDVWSAEAKQLVLSENIIESPYGNNPTFDVFDTEGNTVEALVCVIDDDGEIQGRGMPPYQFNGTIDDDWIITANKANYVQDKREYAYLKTYDTVPYLMDFEDGLDKNWRIYPDSTYGRIELTSEHYPYNGDMHMTMDSDTNGQYATNCADLHLNLTDKNRVVLDFYWREFQDETHTEDGVFMSDDNGDTFTKIYSLINGSGWEHIVLDLDSLATAAGLDYNKNSIIRFQQKDNFSISTDGFAFDDIRVYSMYAALPYSMDFESGFDDYWDYGSSVEQGRIQITSANGPYSGQQHLTMDVDTTGVYATNYADLYLDLEDGATVLLSFYWKDFDDEYQANDGVYFSDDGGANFTKVHDLNGSTHANKLWTEVPLNVTSLASGASLDLTSQFVIRFQQYDNEPINYDGFAFDKIDITSIGRDEREEEIEGIADKLYCYPNPFNPTTTIYFSTNEDIENAEISIYNIKGQLVRSFEIQNTNLKINQVVWDGNDENGKMVSSGVYFYQLNLDGRKESVRKCLLLK